MATEKRLISADFLFDRVLDRIYEHLEKGECDLAAECNNILGMLVGTPAADAVEVVHGRWVHPQDYVVSNGFICSECGHEEASHYPINPRPGGCCIADEHGNFFHPPKINYCPNCGANMMDGDGNA